MEKVGRVISIDPGTQNVGLAVLDGDFRLIELRHSSLPHADLLPSAHSSHRVRWVGLLAEEIRDWVNRYVMPRIPGIFEEEEGELTLVLVEENGLLLHMDWAGIVAGIFVGYPGVRVVTVLPGKVSAWMKGMGLGRLASREEKKRFAVEFVRGLPGGEGVSDDHSADACMNALYLRDRFFSGKKGKKQLSLSLSSP